MRRLGFPIRSLKGVRLKAGGNRIVILILACLLTAVIAPVAFTPHAIAFSTDRISATYQDVDQDGRAGNVVLDMSPGFVFKHDRITVYANNHRFDSRRPWQENVTYEDETWIFDAGAQGRASLIIVYHRDGQALVADLYGDQTGDGQVTYTLQNGRPQVTEGSRFVNDTTPWTVRVVAPEGWWFKGGIINYNLDIQVDGPVLVTFGSEVFADQLKTDGKVDYEVYVRDADHDGRPDYELRNAYPPVSSTSGVYRSVLIVNRREGDKPAENFIFWPYLGSSGPLKGYAGGTLPTDILYDTEGRAYGLVKDYGASFPPIQVEWSMARINYVGEFVASRATEKNWFTQSISPIKLHQLNEPNFENPFAFYDLAGDNDGYPEMEVRIEYNPPNDPFFDDGNFPSPIEAIRYSWDQFNRRQWDFKVGLIGRQVLDGIVQFPDLSVRTIPYDELPYWVTDKGWNSVDFVAVEGTSYWTTEGIYESLGATLETRDKYVSGLSSTPPEPDFAGWPTGLRGEYNLDLQGQPFLYFSPVDRKLHLLKAQAGIWRIDGTREIRYDSLGGDYIRKWTLLEEGKVVKSLYVANDYIIFADNSRVQILQTKALPALFTTLPPRNQDEWARLGTQLENHKPTFPPDDFLAMLGQFKGPQARLTNASLKALRVTPDGFRFILDLRPGFAEDDPESVIGLRNLQAGTYLVTFDGRAFSMRPLTPPQLAVQTLSLSDPSPATLDTINATAVIRNTGLEDAENVPVTFYVTPTDKAGGIPIPLGTVTTTVLSGQTLSVSQPWTPASGGEWKVSAKINGPVAQGAESGKDPGELTAQVRAAPEPFLADLQSLGNSPTAWLAGVALIFVGISGLVVNRIAAR